MVVEDMAWELFPTWSLGVTEVAMAVRRAISDMSTRQLTSTRAVKKEP